MCGKRSLARYFQSSPFKQRTRRCNWPTTAALASPLPCNTNDYNTVMLFSNNIEFGELYVNRQQGEAYHGFHAGWKQSGIGGDNGKHDVFEFLQTRCVYLDYQTDLY